MAGTEGVLGSEGHPMFRKPPPLDIVELVLRSCKLNGLDDRRWFSKEDIPLENLDSWLPFVEPYYLPCKAERYLHGDMTQGKVITVLKHLLKANEIEMKVQERVVNGKKTTLYQVVYYNPNPVVTFD
jgi:hypothetical protein